MTTSFQISGISTFEGREWITGRVLSGTVTAGSSLLAVGTAEIPVTLEEVVVEGTSRPAAAGEEASLYLAAGATVLLPRGTEVYFALVEPGALRRASGIRAEFEWATLSDGPSSGLPGADPAMPPIREDARVELRFCDIDISATLLKPDRNTPGGGRTTEELRFDEPLPVIPGYPFFVEIGGAYAAMGKVLGATE